MEEAFMAMLLHLLHLQNSTCVRPYIVGDWCYPLLSFLMTPISPNADEREVSGCGSHWVAQGSLEDSSKEPKPEIGNDPDEAGYLLRVLDSEKQFYYYGQSLRQALVDDLHQRLSTR